MEGISLQEILFLLGPNSGELVWNIFLYVLFFLALVTLLMMPDKNLIPTLLMSAVLLATLVAKLSLSSRTRPLLDEREFGMLIINIIPFIFPLLTAGTIRAKKTKARAPAILTGLIGAVYFFLFWFIVQRG